MTDFELYLNAQKVYLNIAKVYLIAQKVYLNPANPWGTCGNLNKRNKSHRGREEGRGEFSLALDSLKHPPKDKPKSKPFNYGKRQTATPRLRGGSNVYCLVDYSLEKTLILVGSEPTDRWATWKRIN